VIAIYWLKVGPQRLNKKLRLFGKLVLDEFKPRVKKDRPQNLVELELKDWSGIMKCAIEVVNRAKQLNTLYTSRLPSTQFLSRTKDVMYFLAPRLMRFSWIGRPSGPTWRDSLRKTRSVFKKPRFIK
jgi:hypothetical protein